MTQLRELIEIPEHVQNGDFVLRLLVTEGRGVVELIDVIPSPFTGQGIAVDPRTGGPVGIDRGRRQVVFARFEVR